jgi:O-acetylhomoserine/O-acetylserine sulfhydrylase-like pyridoxal-dependent enzyme
MTGPPPETGSPSAQNRRADACYAQKDLATQCVHAGERWERPAFWPSSTPIHNATTFVYDPPRTSTTWLAPKAGLLVQPGRRAHDVSARAGTLHPGRGRVCGSGMAASHLAVLTAGAGKDAATSTAASTR